MSTPFNITADTFISKMDCIKLKGSAFFFFFPETTPLSSCVWYGTSALWVIQAYHRRFANWYHPFYFTTPWKNIGYEDLLGICSSSPINNKAASITAAPFSIVAIKISWPGQSTKDTCLEHRIRGKGTDEIEKQKSENDMGLLLYKVYMTNILDPNLLLLIRCTYIYTCYSSCEELQAGFSPSLHFLIQEEKKKKKKRLNCAELLGTKVKTLPSLISIVRQHMQIMKPLRQG